MGRLRLFRRVGRNVGWLLFSGDGTWRPGLDRALRSPDDVPARPDAANVGPRDRGRPGSFPGPLSGFAGVRSYAARHGRRDERSVLAAAQPRWGRPTEPPRPRRPGHHPTGPARPIKFCSLVTIRAALRECDVGLRVVRGALADVRQPRRLPPFRSPGGSPCPRRQASWSSSRRSQPRSGCGSRFPFGTPSRI